MEEQLQNIARTLTKPDKKVQLIYAFNGTGKTRLSRAFKNLVTPHKEGEEQEKNEVKIIYYNAFTEDLFYWDNDFNAGTKRILKIHPNDFTQWILVEEGQANNIITLFQHYTNDKLTPRFNEAHNEISFSIESGNEESIEDIKISRGEESCFVWCIFYSLLQEVVEVLSIAEPDQRPIRKFDHLKYVFIDDPVSSLDENHLIELAVNIAQLIKSAPEELKFIITTHNPLFYNVIYNELNSKVCYMLDKNEDGTF